MPDTRRRIFIRNGALALVALGLPPAFLTRSVWAETLNGRRKTMVCVFQRGAVDGLNMVVPFGERAYYESRRSIAVPAPTGVRTSAIDLDGFFALHPALEPLHELWQRRELAIVHAVGSPHPTRSHFEAQEYMETATPGIRTSEGWLNRVLQHTPCSGCAGRTPADPAAHAADHAAGQVGLASSPFRGLALTRALPQAMQGRYPALAVADIDRFGLAGGRNAAAAALVERLYRTGGGDPVTTAGSEAFDAVARLRAATGGSYQPRPGVSYPNGEFGRALRQIAQLVKADVGLEIAFADIGGWDTHANQGGVTGQLPQRLTELARGLRALYDDLGDHAGDTVVLTMSEFGRTVRENGSGGTDHGHANCMLVLGGEIRGGRIYGTWPGLEREQLHEGRDLARTTDFRDVFGEIAAMHLRATRLERIFPDYQMDRGRFLGVTAGA
jgi:uncharacterized protein (DUF1501 family)